MAEAVDKRDYAYKSETMDISVKTLDSKTHEFAELDKEITVPAFKSYISQTVGVPAEQQRLIFRGRVLQDDKKLKDYNVASGQVIHLVTRTATSSSAANDNPPIRTPSSSGPSIVMGPLNFPAGGGITQNQSTVRRRNSAAVRIQVANENLSRASGLLKTLEEEIVILEQESAAAARESPRSDTPTLNEELDNSLNNSMGGPAAAAIVAAISESLPSNTNHGGGMNPNEEQAQPAQPRPPAPMLRELATCVEDYLQLNARLTPFLQTLQRWLRENLELAEGPRGQVQYTYDTLSSVLHSLSHTLHAMSDITIDFSVTPETRRLTAPSSVIFGQSTVVRAAIPIGIDIEGIQIPTSRPNASTTVNPPTSNHGSNPATGTNPSLPVQVEPTNVMFQGGRIGFSGLPFGMQFNSPGTNTNNTHSGQGPAAGIQQAIAAALQAIGGNRAPGVMVGGPITVPVSSGFVSTTATAPTQPSDTTTTAPSSSPNQNNNNMPQDLRSLLGSLSSQSRPFDLLLQCRSHHHRQGQSNQPPARPDGLLSFLSEQSGITTQQPPRADETVMEAFYGLLQVLNPLRPIISQYIKSALLRGRNPNNRSHIQTAVRVYARRLVSWMTEPLKPSNDEAKLQQLSQGLIELFTEFLASCVESILDESNRTLVTTNLTRLIGIHMPRVRVLFQEAYSENDHLRIIKGIILMSVNELFPQSSLMFRTQVTTAISGALETISYVPDGSDSRIGEDHADMEIDIDVRVRSPSPESHSSEPMQQTPVAANPILHVQSEAQPTQPQHPTPTAVIAEPQMSNHGAHSESDDSDIEAEFHSAASELFRGIPDGWRNCMIRDMQRQETLREAGPPPLSPEYLALFPQK